MRHALSWFEISVENFSRAKQFYEKVLGISIESINMGSMTMGILSSDQNAVGGAIVQGQGCVPSKEGTIVYLNGGDDLTPMLERVESAGGTIVLPKTEIGGDCGYFAHFIDTEGNKVGLHSMA